MREPDMCDNLQANEERKRSLLDPSSPPFIYIHLLRRLFAQLLFNEWLKFINSSSHGNLSISFQTEIYQFLFIRKFINSSSHDHLSIPLHTIIYQFSFTRKFINSSSHGNLSIPLHMVIYQFLFTQSFINSISNSASAPPSPFLLLSFCIFIIFLILPLSILLLLSFMCFVIPLYPFRTSELESNQRNT